MIPSTVIFFVWSFCLLNTLSPLTVALEETGDENTFTLLFSTLKPALLKQKSSMCLPGRISKTVFNGGAKTLLWQLRHVRQVVHAHTHTQHAHARTQTLKQVHKEALQVSDARMSPYISTFQTCAAHVCRNLLADAEAQVSVVRKSWSKPSNAGSADLQHVANKSQNSFFPEQLLSWDKGMSQVRWSCFFFLHFFYCCRALLHTDRRDAQGAAGCACAWVGSCVWDRGFWWEWLIGKAQAWSQRSVDLWRLMRLAHGDI